MRVASGNFLEMYDFIVYGYYATYIAKTFFPTGNDFASLMLSLMTFGVGYLMRPIGAVVLGSYIDRVGRRQGLIVTLGLMAIGTLTIAATPSYAVASGTGPRRSTHRCACSTRSITRSPGAGRSSPTSGAASTPPACASSGPRHWHRGRTGSHECTSRAHCL